jgi:predicted transcriptional regulator of viral defense system
MADSVYISEHLTKPQLEFLKLLDDHEIQLFKFSEIEKLLKQKFDNLNEMLENLVDKELLIRIEKGKFCKQSFKDEYVIGTFVVENSAVAYWSALNLHGLTEQFSNTIFIQTTHKKNDKSILGTPYKFVKIAPYKKLGITHNGYGNFKYPITDVEKTIVDCFDLPQHSGGYAELIRAVGQSQLQSIKLIEYCKALNNTAVTKRIGYLVELLKIQDMSSFVDFAKEQVKNKYNLFDPQGLDKGEFVAEWRLRLNISREELLDISNKQYV